MNKTEELHKLRDIAQRDESLPLRDGATQLVFGAGNPESRLFFLGEAPGFHEDQKGIPFVGRAGQLLDRTLEEIGIPRPTIWISNVVYFRPPANRDPQPEEIEAFKPYVDKQIEIIDPDIIITLGRFSMGKFLPDVKISQVHGQPKWILFAGRKRVLIPMYHPAAALRSTALLQSFNNDFTAIPKVIKKLEKLRSDKGKDSDPQEQMKLFK
ncbi:MAG: Uracil DNA glycosylase superfamily protein [bacterium ADurb.Bin400]|nr:MAG: Uracil DNA glycosylase superfamily protein [bacterium ADurb.Bin400]